MLKKRELVFKTRRLSNCGNLYLPPFDWQQPSLLKFFQSWKVRSQKAKNQNQRIQYSQRSTHADLIFWHVSTLCEQRSGLLNSTSCNFYNQHCVWLLSILPATLQVTQEHCVCNQITISFDYFYLIMKPTIVFPSRLSSHASTLSPSQYLFTSIHHLTQSSHELTKISSAYQYILLFIRTM
jgi:hypothetical protein